ncbi:hypothetical protein QQS21_007270 [Conoideocrella luteorostrata]|uniref:Glucoamylase n=1 Tax=Conoideocrella luteorostrata TaxID=1105319 RepID=A0AAJ0FS79_9HYPO|nr:hypothetical protein QQS21_007270 [Conoideocrella luteorostrata]
MSIYIDINGPRDLDGFHQNFESHQGHLQSHPQSQDNSHIWSVPSLGANMIKNLLATLAVTGLCLDNTAASPGRLRCRDVSDFVTKQSAVSIKGVLANIGSDGSKAQGAAAGVVVASPSRSDPDYWYTWTRDSALTFKVLVERFTAGDKTLQPKIQQYIAAQAKLQSISNPSDGPDSGGLGEPKFNVDLSAFTGPWGRPQRDGPPLRATALTIYANWLLANGGQTEATNTVWPVISKDLDYAVQYWNRTGFDLWEEVNGSSFFTIAATHRALVEGAALAKALGKDCPNCVATASQALCFAQTFWVDGYIDSNINVNDGRTGKDVNSIISSIHTFDPTAACTDSTFQPCSARALANHKAVVDSFRAIYGVNNGRTAGQAAAVGRYSEDVYYKGNPWYLATLAAAEQLYAAAYQWNKLGSITVNSVSLPFFKDLLPSIATGIFAKDSDTFKSIIKAVTTYADGFVAVVQQYTPSDGALAEQFDRNSGSPLSAVHLTWSYAAFVSAADRRAGILPASWGEPTSNTVPAVCSAAPSCDSTMTFNVKVATQYGENIFLTGSLSELKNWSPSDAIPLSANKYTPDSPVWSVDVKVPAATKFEYKYIKKTGSGSIVWLGDPNISGTSSTGCGSSGAFNDVWR